MIRKYLFTVAIVLVVQLSFSFRCSAQYNIQAFLSSAEKDIINKNFLNAIEKLNICIETEPQNLEAFFYRGVCKYSLSDNAGAEQDLTVAVSNYSPFYYEALHYRSQVMYLLGKYPEGINDVSKVIEKENKNPKLYIERAFIKLAAGNFREAIEDCNKAMSLQAIGEDVLLCKAGAENALADYDNALCDYDQAIKINPGNAESLARRGITKYSMENYSGAMEDYNHSISLDSSYTFAYYNRAETEIKLNENKKALSDYNIVLAYEPRNAFAYFNRAVLFSNMQQFKNAIADFDKVLSINPDNIEALLNRGKLRQNVKDFSGAISDYDKILELYPYFMEAYFNRAQAKLSLKDPAGSKKDFETGKLMSELFHSKNINQLRSDSVLLGNLLHLSADFNHNETVKADTLNINFQPVFYVAERDTILNDNSYYLPLLEKIDKQSARKLCFTNRETQINFKSISPAADSGNTAGENNALDILSAIKKTNSSLLNDANECYDKIIAVEKTNALAFFERGVNTCREIEMLNNINEPYIIKPENKNGRNEISDKYQSAIKDFTKAIEFQPSFAFAYFDRANIKCLLSDFNGALLDYEAAIKINPDFSQAYYNKGFILYYLNDRDQACGNFSKAGELGLAESYLMMKQYCNK